MTDQHSSELCEIAPEHSAASDLDKHDSILSLILSDDDDSADSDFGLPPPSKFVRRRNTGFGQGIVQRSRKHTASIVSCRRATGRDIIQFEQAKWGMAIIGFSSRLQHVG
jgi:hypothetical protein